MTTVDTEKHFENWVENYFDSLMTEFKMSEVEVDEYRDNISDEKLKGEYNKQTGSIQLPPSPNKASQIYPPS